jgi:hypothetical protein
MFAGKTHRGNCPGNIQYNTGSRKYFPVSEDRYSIKRILILKPAFLSGFRLISWFMLSGKN